MPGLIGSDTPVDDLVSEYFPGRPSSDLYQVFEDETTVVLACLLMEMRGQRPTEDEGSSHPSYFSTADDPLDVTTTSEESEAWEFPAQTVVVYDFDAPVSVAFKPESQSDRAIPLSPSQGPFTLSPPTGLNASELWYRKQDSADNDTTLRVLAIS